MTEGDVTVSHSQRIQVLFSDEDYHNSVNLPLVQVYLCLLVKTTSNAIYVTSHYQTNGTLKNMGAAFQKTSRR